MPRFLTNLVIHHQSLNLFYRFPGLIRLQHAIAWLTTQRFWCVYLELKRILTKKGHITSHVLDIGCASGEILFPLIRRFPDCQYTGVDVSDEALATCKRLAEHNGFGQVEFVKSNLLDYQLEKPPDLIFCVSLLQLMPERERTFSKLLSFLKPGAVLLIYVPVNFKRIIPGYRKLRAGWLKESDYCHYYVEARDLSAGNLQAQLQKAGAHEVQIKYCYGIPGKIAYELVSLGILMTLRLNWLLAVPFALLYFPVVMVPAWLLMGIDMLCSHRTGNGLILVVKKSD